MNRIEFDNGMKVLFAGHEEPSEMVIASFWMVLEKMQPKIFVKAIQLAISEGFYGAPKPSDVIRASKEIIKKGLKQKDDRKDLLLQRIYAEAIEEAERRNPPVSGTHQFRSPEDLDAYYFWREKKLREETEEIYKEKLIAIERNLLNGLPYEEAVGLEFKQDPCPENYGLLEDLKLID